MFELTQKENDFLRCHFVTLENTDKNLRWQNGTSRWKHANSI